MFEGQYTRMVSHLNKIGILPNLGQEHAEELHLLALCGRRLEKTYGKGEETTRTV
jgi:hypothetical protein